ncbi:hypothetical protein D3C74_217050 [compost metagenome]
MTAINEELPQQEPILKAHRPWYIKAVATLAILITTWHILASFLWIAPWSYLRDAVPGNALHAYMLPMYGQSWSVFAPEPINGNYRFQVRAEIEVDGKLSSTNWLDVTHLELEEWKTHKLLPPRASSMAMQQASTYKSAYDKLGAGQQTLLGSGFYKGDDWANRLEATLRETKPNKGVTDVTNDIRLDEVIAAERNTTAFATQVAKAAWGSNVKYVQFEVSRQNAIPFAKRNDPEAKPPARVFVSPGWRGLLVVDGQDEEQFAKIFPVEDSVEAK